jgi:hypothetical protein
LSHSTSPFSLSLSVCMYVCVCVCVCVCVREMGFFKIGSLKLFAPAGFELQSS